MKWLLIGIGGLILFQFLRSSNGQSLTDRLGGGSSSSSLGGASGLINSLSNLTNSIGKLFHGGSTTVTDRDALINPDF